MDATDYHQLLSFIDAYLGYNQIRLHPPDKEHTSFITNLRLYYYKVMPFSLKSVGATYKRSVNRMFFQQIGKTMEVYIDNMLVKSVRAKDNLTHLTEMFDVLRAYGMKLNPNKCAFGVSSSRFVGFMVNQRGIKANLDKIRDILEMEASRATKDVQHLTRRIAALK